MSDGKKDADDLEMDAGAETSVETDAIEETATESAEPEAVEAEASAEAEAHEEPAFDESHDDHHYDDDHHDDQQGSGFATKALVALLLLIGGGALALIVGPKLAPMLPAGVAQYLAPGSGADVDDMEARIAALEDALEVSANALQSQLAASIEQNAAADADLSARIEASEATISALEGADVSALTARIDDAEATLAGLREELRALSGQPGVEGGTISDAAISGLRAELAALKQNADATVESRVAPLEQDVAALETRLSAAESAVSAGAASGKGAANAAAFAVLSTAVNSASPYAAELETFTSVSGVAAPEALAASAATGAPSLSSLTATFPEAARAAISAAKLAAAGENYTDQALAWLESQVAVRPVGETEGDTPAAVISRAEARLSEGSLAAALAELDALPTVSKDAMAGWTARAEKRAAVDAGLAELATSMLPGAAPSN